MIPDRQRMSQKFIRLTSGWIPVSVLILLATALIMGRDDSLQAREAAAPAAPAATVVAPGLPDSNDQVRLESIRKFEDSVLPVPEIIEISFGATIRTGPETGQPDNASAN